MVSMSLMFEKIERVCRANLDAETFRHEVMLLLRRAVPFDSLCWPLLDPDTLLPFEPTSYNPIGMLDHLRVFELDYQMEERASLIALSQSRKPLTTLSIEAGGDFTQSLAWAEILRPHSLGDEMRVMLTANERCWGCLILYRARSARPFTSNEETFMQRLIHPVATGLRQTIGSPPLVTTMPSPGPGVVVLGTDLRPMSMTPLAQQWLRELWPQGLGDHQPLPPLLFALIARLEAIEKNYVPASWVPRVRMRSSAGCWFVLQVERLASSPLPDTFALTIQPAPAAQMQLLLLQAFALTKRERELTLLVLQGLSTAEIAAALHISVYTVQEHLKAIFAKVHVRSRRELVARLGMGY